MPKFALKSIKLVVGRIKFFKLEIDGTCQFDNFTEAIEKDGNLKRQLVTVYSRMNDIANLRGLPKEKFRDITPKKETVKEYEIKTGDLRVYLIKDSQGHLVILGGKKSTQQKDIKEFRSIKSRFINQKHYDI